MALKSGFYNAFLVNGDYDRKYNADDYSNNIGAFIRSGVLRDANDGLKVSANGLVVSVAIGRAWLEGHWAYLDTPHTFGTITPPVGSYSRIDTVVMRSNSNPADRTLTLEYITGTPASNPQPTAPTRENGVFEIVLANITVAPNATSVTVEDKRADMDVCGWVTSPIGYDDFFATFDNAFNAWFAEKKYTLSTVTLFKDFKYRTVLESQASAITFDIPQYDSTGVDIIQVYVNGLLEIEGVDYTLNGSTITFGTGGGGTGIKTAGTEIVVICWKAYDGSNLGSVEDRITELENAVATMNGSNEFTYICNGLDDNVKLSEIAQAYLDGGDDYGSKKINVVGTFGAQAPFAGSGTTASAFRWLSVGGQTVKNRKLIFDFTNCSQINIPITAGTTNTIFFGVNAHIIGANVIANQTGNGTVIKMFSDGTDTVVIAEDCRFWVSAYYSSVIGRTGTFKNCRASVTNISGDSFCFTPNTYSLLRITGGEYYAYAGNSTGKSAVVNQTGTNSASILFAVNAPTVYRSGYYQTNSIIQATGGGTVCCTDLISALSLSVISGASNIRGTIAVSKAGLM